MTEQTENAVWYTVPEALTYLRVSKTTLYTCMKDGRLPFYYIQGTRQRRLKRDDLDALLVKGNPAEFVDTDEDDS